MWFVYMLECADGTIYTGITKDLGRRVAEHNGIGPQGAKYTAGRRPVRLIYQCECGDKSAATKEEMRIKSLTKQAKRILAAS